MVSDNAQFLKVNNFNSTVKIMESNKNLLLQITLPQMD